MPGEEIAVSQDMKLVDVYFPELDGIEEVVWVEKMQTQGKTRIPGPTDYHYVGYMTLSKEKASEIQLGYEDWQEVAFQPEEDGLEIETLEQHTWYESDDFTEQYLPMYLHGNLYFDQEVIWFDFRTS